MLDERGIEYRYREYRKEPLSEAEIRQVLGHLGMRPGDVLRRRDRAYTEQGLTGGESDDRLIALMAEHPTLLQRPIGVKGKRIGREEQRPAVLTFLIDTSGSMETPERLGLLQKSLRMLVEALALGRDPDFRNGRDADGPIFPVGDVDPRLPVHEDVIGVITASGRPVAFQRSKAFVALKNGDDIVVENIRLELDAGGIRAVDADGSDLGGLSEILCVRRFAH